ncbi:MAG: cell surface protein SprA [Ignavibacteriaceae bacterium]
MVTGDSLFAADSLSTDSSLTKADSLAIDSTARLKYFRYHREDLPYVKLKKSKQSSFFINPSDRYIKRVIEIDSTGQYVEIREYRGEYEHKILLRIPIDEYINAKLAARERELWEELGYEYNLKDTKTGLADIIKDITDFEIPLPKVGVLSIFGEPKISLKIGGSVQIHGAWRNETTEGVTASLLGNTRNEPDFKQQVQVNVNGTIGDKLNISADWNTERTFEYENQLKIKYTGYEDEIIQSIEAGNVSLQTSPLVGGSEALFGIKAQFKMGPFTLTTIASQKKGEIQEVSVSGGATSQEYQIRAYEYSKNHYFLDTVYASRTLNLFENYYGSPTPLVDQQYYVNDIEVWKSVNVTTGDRSKERIANAYINLEPLLEGQDYDDVDTSLRQDLTNPIPGLQETGRFVLLTRDLDYTLHPETGYITFNTDLNDQDIIAVAYRVENDPSTSADDFRYGEFLTTANTDTSERLVLKLVKPRGLQPQYDQAWKLLLKNIYPTGTRNIKDEGFEFNIKYELDGQEPVTELPTPGGNVRLLNAFGLDILGPDNSPTTNDQGDNVFDYRPGITIIPTTGEIIFPFLEPFGRDLPDAVPDSLAYLSVYDTTVTFAQQDKSKDKWVMTGKSTGDATSVYQLGFNIVENSVRVLLDGRELTPGVDYVVDYNIGQLTIRNDAALVPGANLKITYEQNDLFQLASKTLLGARGLYEFSDKTKLGFSLLNLNQQTLSDKVRIGEEPLNNTIYGVDFSTSGDLPFLTRLLDNVISTREMSTFTFSGEYAYINPDPNTKKSTITSDQGKSIAYIDDFEGAKRTIPIGVGYTTWKDLSPPDSIPTLQGLSKPDMMSFKGKSFWFNVTPSDVEVQDIFGDRKQVARSDQQITVMDYVFIPDTPGTYNAFPELNEPVLAWGGMQKILSSTASNLIEENVEFIEFWLKLESAPDQSKIYIDLGRISEDVIPNNILDTEDKDFNDAIDVAGTEDTGLDGILDAEERTQNNSSAPDPNNDNFSFNGGTNLFDYFNINGTQGNATLTDIGRIPDTEDLNKNGNLDQYNSYFRYEIPLDTIKETNSFIQGGGDNEGWYLFRVPLKDFALEVGSPTLSNVEYIRLFTYGVEEMVHFRITDFNLVGNQWQKVLPEDTIMSVSVISFEDNPDYEIPPGIQRERDRTRPDENILANEQSLNLIVKDLPDGQFREAVKYLYRPLDVFNYEEMKLFIHGDKNTTPGSVSSDDSTDYSSEVYFRFGIDSNSYYEYRQPVRPGWNEISIVFDELTAIKQARDSANVVVKIPVEGKAGHFYRVKGNPTLTSVKFLLVGIQNVNNGNGVDNVSGEVWVNELRVIGADDSPGWAYSFSSSVKFADLLTVNGTLSQTNPYFHKLSDRFGSRIEQTSWSISSELNVLKLIPVSLPESNLKLNYSHTESLGKPLYIPGTDVLVEEAARVLDETKNDSVTTTKTGQDLISETQTLNISDTWSASGIKIKIPTKDWYINDTFNALTYGFNYNKTFSRSPTVLSNKSWIWNANVTYALSLSPDYYFKPADIPVLGSIIEIFTDYKDLKIYFTPQTFSANASAKRNRSVNLTRPTGMILSEPVITRDFTTTRGFNFNWKFTEGGFLNLSSNYNVIVNSSLAFLETDEFGNQRSEGEIWNDILSSAGFGQEYYLQQTVDFRTSPKLPSLWDIKKYFTITAGYNSSYTWNNDFRQVELGRSARFTARTTLGLTLRWKALTEPLFQETEGEVKTTKEETRSATGDRRGRNRDIETALRILQLEEEIKLQFQESGADTIDQSVIDSLLAVETSDLDKPKESSLKKALLFMRSAVKFILFDYESFTINFSNDNSLSKSGIAGKGNGFNNFWGFTFDEDEGPSRGFMLGLDDKVGRRAPNGNLSDAASYKNNLEIRTSRPLWEGAKIDINWKVGWSTNKTTSLISDEQGNVTVSNITSSGTLKRSFFSMPPVLFLTIFKSGISRVNELYNPAATDGTSNLSNAFIQGFESLPLLSNLGFLEDFVKYIPRPNWSLTWDGLEKISIFKNIAERVSLNHVYSSNYTEGWNLDPDGKQQIQTQKIEYGFQPLVGLNITFGKLWGGSLTGNIKYSTSTAYDLGVTTNNITETFSKDIGVTASFSKSGFEIPLFGVSLKNDVEFSFSYTSSQNSVTRFEMNNFTEEGIPQDGTTRITIEPRIKYTISSKVTLSIFYKRSTTEPEGAARIPPSTINEAGLDVTITIQ